MWSTRSPASVVRCALGNAEAPRGVKEHRDACKKGDTWKSAIAEHQWYQQHQIGMGQGCWTGLGGLSS